MANKPKEPETTQEAKDKAKALFEATGVWVPPESFEGINGVEVGVFLGANGEGTEETFMPYIHNSYVPVDKAGNPLVPVDKDGKYIDPRTMPEFGSIKIKTFKRGDVVFFPGAAANEQAYTNAVRAEQFAHVSFLPRIQEWFKIGKTGRQVMTLIKAEGGLVGQYSNPPHPHFSQPEVKRTWGK